MKLKSLLRTKDLTFFLRNSDDYVLDEELHLDGYHEIIRRDRNRNGGGVALYIHKSIPYTNRNDLLCDLEICTAQLNIHNVKLILFSSVYRPPDSKVELFDQLDKGGGK